jgi:predicted TPR repeat methyltransferase
MTMAQADKELQEVTLDEAMSIAIVFQKHGQLDDAADVYRRVLELWPDHVDALHFSGVLAHQRGQSDAGLALVDRSLELNADQPDCYNNRGIILKALHREEEAAGAYRKAIALNPKHANAHSNLGVLLRAEGRFEEAEAEYREAIAINPDHIDAYHNLGTLLAAQKRTKEAMLCYSKVTVLSPSHREARRLLAMAHCALGEPEKAVQIFQKWLEEEPGSPVARHMLAACSGEAVPQRAPDDYVEKVFDDFASSFETKLTQLFYQAPAIVEALVADAGVQPEKALSVLDAGCGTGLCGPLIAKYAKRLVGVDLSGGMLERAAEKQVYDKLYKGELVEFLRGHPGEFDLVVSADTLVYFGALEDLADAASRALRPGGLLVFTLEALDAERDGPDYEIQKHGRYCHARGYVERLLAGAGMDVTVVAAELRMEAGAPVAGLAVRARVREGNHRG